MGEMVVMLKEEIVDCNDGFDGVGKDLELQFTTFFSLREARAR